MAQGPLTAGLLGGLNIKRQREVNQLKKRQVAQQTKRDEQAEAQRQFENTNTLLDFAASQGNIPAMETHLNALSDTLVKSGALPEGASFDPTSVLDNLKDFQKRRDDISEFMNQAGNDPERLQAGVAEIKRMQADFGGIPALEKGVEGVEGLVPEERKTLKDVGGVNRFVDTGEQVFAGAEPKVPVRKTLVGADGRNRFVDTGDFVFPNESAPVDDIDKFTRFRLDQEKRFPKLTEEDIQRKFANLNDTGEFVVTTNPDGTVVVSKGKGGKPMSAAAGEKFVKLLEFSNELDAIESLADPAFIGWFDNIKGQVKELTGIGVEAKEVAVRRMVNNITDTILRLRSGAQINEQEMVRMLKLVPELGKSFKAFEAKLTDLKREITASIDIRRRAGEEQGFIVPSGGGTPAKSKFKIIEVK
jgi:hypothetical protein